MTSEELAVLDEEPSTTPLPVVPTPPVPSADNGPELRVALALRGGISLAVWIGGALAELDLARRGMATRQTLTESPPESPQEPPVEPPVEPPEDRRARAYADLLEKLGYSSVQFDVLAGASAGGLNAVIYGFAQSIGADLEGLKEVWESKGDIWKLFHPEWDPSKPFGTEAVFDADSNFYRPLAEALFAEAHKAAKAPKKAEQLKARYLTVDLSATLRSGPPLPDRRTGADIRPRAAHFRFRHTPAPLGPFNDIPGHLKEGYVPAVARLAYAARTTSSFPGAFEPAGVFSWEAPGDVVPPRVRRKDLRPRNMRNVFSEIGSDPASCFDVMDGGVFDNIPISRAVQAIADAPASGPTRRILIYLDPSSSVATPAQQAEPAYNSQGRVQRPGFLGAVFTALKDKQTVESSWDDLRELQQLRAATKDRSARRKLFFECSPDMRCPDRPGDPVFAAYRTYRNRLDAARVVTLMTEPGVGFLRTLVPPPAFASALGLDQAGYAQKELEAALGRHCPNDVCSDATALLSATDLFISLIRKHQDEDGRQLCLDHAKERVYRVRMAASFLQQSEDADAVKFALGTGDSQPSQAGLDFDLMAHALRLALTFGQSQHGPKRIVAPSAASLSTDKELWSSITATEAPAERAALLTACWVELCDAVNDITESNANSVLKDLGLDAKTDALTISRIQWLTVRAAATIGSLGTTAVPDFFTITADEEPVDTGEQHPLEEVEDEGRRLRIDRLVAEEPEASAEDDALVKADGKLAGNQLAAFGGFLSTRWRTHDWQWGRADGGAGLLRILTELHSTTDEGRRLLTGAKDEFNACASQIALQYSDLNVARPRLRDLPATRRFAITARFGLALQRALWPLVPRSRAPEGKPLTYVKTPLRLALAALLMLLRPGLVLIPLMVRPGVLLSVALALSASQHLAILSQAGPQGLRSDELILAMLLIAATLVGRLISLAGQGNRWRSIAKSATSVEARICDRVRNRIRGELGWAAFCLASCLIALVVGAIPLAPLPLSGFDVVALLGLAVGRNVTLARLRASALGPAPKARVKRTARQVGKGLAIGVVGAGLTATAWFLWSPAAGSVVGTSAAVGILIWGVHHAWSRAGWALGMAVIGGVTTGLTVSGIARWSVAVQLEEWVSTGASGAWQPVAVLGVIAVLLGAVLLLNQCCREVAAFFNAREWANGSTIASVLNLAVVLVLTIYGTWLLTLSLDWLKTLPLALVLGSVAAAATTMVAPFGELEDVADDHDSSNASINPATSGPGRAEGAGAPDKAPVAAELNLATQSR